MTKRTLHSQKPIIVDQTEDGYIYSVIGIETTVDGDREVLIYGPAIREFRNAPYAANKAAVAWLMELGEVHSESDRRWSMKET